MFDFINQRLINQQLNTNILFKIKYLKIFTLRVKSLIPKRQGMAHILIVDDSPTEASFIKKILEGQGYKTSKAENGEEGIQKAKEIRPDLVIMDVVMPGLNGFQATRKITKNPETSSIPVIIVSSKNLESDRAWGLKQGAKEFLVKPVSKEKLLEAVKKQLG